MDGPFFERPGSTQHKHFESNLDGGVSTFGEYNGRKFKLATACVNSAHVLALTNRAVVGFY